MNKKICLILNILLLSISVKEINSSENDAVIDSTAPIEIQHAICKISTKDIQATANATITHQLKNVCTTSEIQSLIQKLEEKLLNEIFLIKQALQIEPQVIQTLQIKSYDNVVKNDLQENIVNLNDTKENLKKMNITYKRDLESIKYNFTTQNSNLGEAFLYFWKVYDIQNILTLFDQFVDSPQFYFGGSSVNIRLFSHYLGSNYVGIQLISNNQRYVMKHRFIILNQIAEEGDLSSQILGEKASMFKIANQKITTDDFTADGSLMIKLMLYH